MKKKILVMMLAAMMTAASVVPSFAESPKGLAQGFGGSSTMTAETNGHWIQNRDGSWSFANDESGGLWKGWIVSQHQWYYIGANGVMLTGWQRINYEWYYFAVQRASSQPVGSLYMNKLTPDNYHVDGNGVWVG